VSQGPHVEDEVAIDDEAEVEPVGAKLCHQFPVSIVTDGQGLNITVVSSQYTVIRYGSTIRSRKSCALRASPSGPSHRARGGRAPSWADHPAARLRGSGRMTGLAST